LTACFRKGVKFRPSRPMLEANRDVIAASRRPVPFMLQTMPRASRHRHDDVEGCGWRGRGCIRAGSCAQFWKPQNTSYQKQGIPRRNQRLTAYETDTYANTFFFFDVCTVHFEKKFYNEFRNAQDFNLIINVLLWARYLSLYSDWLRAGRSGNRIPVGARFSAPVQTGPGAHTASCTMGTGSFPGVESGRGVTLPSPPYSAVV
jgi:hypothetical protein